MQLKNQQLKKTIKKVGRKVPNISSKFRGKRINIDVRMLKLYNNLMRQENIFDLKSVKKHLVAEAKF